MLVNDALQYEKRMTYHMYAFLNTKDVKCYNTVECLLFMWVFKYSMISWYYMCP